MSDNALSDPHHTWTGSRVIRTADGDLPAMPFARCRCGWEGPSRLTRGAARQDGRDHRDNPERTGE